jgi:transposase
MKLHANAALRSRQRGRMVSLLVDQGWSIPAAAEEFRTSPKTRAKWVARFGQASEVGLLDRSSACATVANRTDERRIEAIAAWRRLRFSGPEIADVLEMPLSTVSGILTRIGMGQLGRLGQQPAQRYEPARAGELIHIDVKSSGASSAAPASGSSAGTRTTPARPLTSPGVSAAKPAGISFMSRSMTPRGWPTPKSLAYAEVLPNEKAGTAVGFLGRALAFDASYGITAERVITDGSPYRSAIRAIACRALGARHLRTRPRCPQTNGEAERFIRTMLGSWPTARSTPPAENAPRPLTGWLFTYNHRRRHAGIGRPTPITRLNNLLGTYS